MRKRVYGLIAVCLIFCMLLPHRIVEAASGEMKMDRSSKILYLNEDNPGNYPRKYDFSIKNKPANYKTTYKFQWSADDSSIVSVDRGGACSCKEGWRN